jgi:hypothetical protein
MSKHRKLFVINTALLSGLALVFFRAYLPVTEDITDLNLQIKSLEKQFNSFKNHASVDKVATQTVVHALPDTQVESLSQQLEALGVKHAMTLITLNQQPEKSRKIPRLDLTITPYKIGFSGKSLIQFSALVADLEMTFPELTIEALHYDNMTGSLDVQLLTSSKSVRLFSP